MLKFHPRIAPIKAAVFPLVKRDGMPEKAEAIYRELKRHYNVFYDEKGAIGRRYRRQDEAGTPFCITVDSQTLTDGTVTIRDRDSCRQWRVAAAGVARRSATCWKARRSRRAPDGMVGRVRRDRCPAKQTARNARSSTFATGPMRNHRVLDRSHETLHQPSDDPEEPVRGGPGRAFPAAAGPPSSSG